MKLAFIVSPQHLPLVMTAGNCLFDASSVIFLGLYQVYAHAGMSRFSIFAFYAGLSLFLSAGLTLSWTGAPNRRLHAASLAEAAREELSGGEERPPLHGLSWVAQLRTFEAAFAYMFLAVHLFRSNSYLGTNKDLLARLGDAETGNTYTQIFAALLPASTVCVPLISFCLRRGGFAITFQLTNFFAVAWNVVALIPSLELQVVASVAFTNFRALLYSAYFTYLGHTFGSRTSGRVHAIIVILAAGGSFLIWPPQLCRKRSPTACP
eukprot:gb/GFBE01020808.1/.p1 GENE.gb/GFBE01020808.1/~~gb/GFBE01020808.1/.p1  ORF type:complete len:265 (+),score=45.39 gb/GFBE01020808.1/:1-795(+)